MSPPRHITAFADLRNGPVVLEVPAASEAASLYGQVVDAWQYTIADVGQAGLDAGNGGKYLFTPPGHDGPVPDGYLHIDPPNYRIAFAFRSIPKPGHTTGEAYDYSRTLRCITSPMPATHQCSGSSTPATTGTPPCRSTTNDTSTTCSTSSAWNRSNPKTK